MTPHEIELSIALGNCALGAGTRMRRFVWNMDASARSSPGIELTVRQRYYLELMAWRLRRQLAPHLIPNAKPPRLPPKKIPPRKRKAEIQTAKGLFD